MPTVFTNIGKIYQTRPSQQPILTGSKLAEVPSEANAFLRVSDQGRILEVGSMQELQVDWNEQMIDLKHRTILPCFVDSHTHMVFASGRQEEFVMKIKGASYEDIAAAGGGILNSAKKLQETSFEQLLEDASRRVSSAIASGTGALEIKSGYGLNTAAEIKMLQVIAALNERFDIPIKATFLGAHAFPNKDQDKYMHSLIHEMLPEIHAQQLAHYIDCFCEKNYFNPMQMKQVLEAGAEYGLKPKVHVNQFNAIGGIKVALDCGALSVDHLEVLTEEDFADLKDSTTIPLALPGCSFFSKLAYSPAQQIISEGLPLVLASDFNPGSAPSFNMAFINSLACIQMGLLPEEAFNATTFNASFALELENEVGSITKGKRANFIVAQPDFHLYDLSYHVANPWIDQVFINGKVFST